MLWSVLIASHVKRAEQLKNMVAMLEPQLVDGVEVVVLWNRGRRPLGDYRRLLCENARGEYVCFVDDDDRLPDHYVSDIVAAFGEDYVGFEIEVLDMAGVIGRPGQKYRAIHSIRNKRWHQVGDVFYRHVSHLNPIRRDLALKGVWEGNQSEDHRWADSTVQFVRSENYIDKVMYYYDFNHPLSLRGNQQVEGGYAWPLLPDGFRLHPESED